MTNSEREKILLNYLEANVAPILVESNSIKNFKNMVSIDGDCSVGVLNGHYEGKEFVAPSWYNELITFNNKKSVLMINNINSANLNDQSKFIEILKYRKINTFELPSNCVVIATYTDLKSKPINEEVYSLFAHI